MSAFIVDRNHITTILQAAEMVAERFGFSWYDRLDQRHEIRVGDDDALTNAGGMLWAENIRSVAYRYPNVGAAGLPGPVGERFDEYEYPFSMVVADVNVVGALKALDCYEYQSCQTPDWPETEAYRFCQNLRHELIRRLPGYDDAPWEVTELRPSNVVRLI